MHTVHTHNFYSNFVAEIIHLQKQGQNCVHMFLVCAQILTYVTCISENEAHISCSIERLSSGVSCQHDYLTFTPHYW